MRKTGRRMRFPEDYWDWAQDKQASFLSKHLWIPHTLSTTGLLNSTRFEDKGFNCGICHREYTIKASVDEVFEHVESDEHRQHRLMDKLGW